MGRLGAATAKEGDNVARTLIEHGRKAPLGAGNADPAPGAARIGPAAGMVSP
jgi:hypothetical protein